MKNNLNIEVIHKLEDKHIGVQYTLCRCNAKELSDYLKNNLEESGIDYNQFNGEYGKSDYSGEKAKIVENPPLEIYEYQNFFLLEKNDGEYVLLDGFRRLLYYNAPFTEIMIRIYKHLTSEKILSLMVYLNHFKFYGGGSYHERGFSLLLRTVFGLNINKYMDTFNGYLSGDQTKSYYRFDEKNPGVKFNTIKDRIVNPHFIADIQFLEKMCDRGFMVNAFVGSFLYSNRKVTDIDFSDSFIESANNNKALQPLLDKWSLHKTSLDVKNQKIIDQILEIYQNILNTQMCGGEIEKSYAEKMEEAKAMLTEIKKDKTLSKITGSQNDYLMDSIMNKRLKLGIPIRFKMVIYPSMHVDALPYGVREDIGYITKGPSSSSYHHNDINYFGIIENGKTYCISHNWEG